MNHAKTIEPCPSRPFPCDAATYEKVVENANAVCQSKADIQSGSRALVLTTSHFCHLPTLMYTAYYNLPGFGYPGSLPVASSPYYMPCQSVLLSLNFSYDVFHRSLLLFFQGFFNLCNAVGTNVTKLMLSNSDNSA